VNALGPDPEAIWPRLVAGDQSRFTLDDHLVPERTLLLGAVHDPLPEIPSDLRRFACRNNAMALAALRQIEAQVAAVRDAVGAQRVGVVMGTSTSGVGDAEVAIGHRQREGSFPPDFYYAQLEFGGAASFIATVLGVRGPTYTLSTACSSRARALATARSLLSLGVCDAVVAGACDSLCGLTTNGFSALQAVSEGVTNPCSANRRGLTLGEGAAIFLVTPEPGGIQLLGVGESSEAHHMSAPEPGGAGAEVAMREALRDAHAPPESIAYVNLHGTGTPLNDSMECEAVARVLGTDVPCSSSKALVGHTLGAAGAMEAAFCWLMLRHREGGRLPVIPHCWDGARDPALPEIRLPGAGESVETGESSLVMSNSFGFGGNNCTLVLGQAPQARAARPSEGNPRGRPEPSAGVRRAQSDRCGSEAVQLEFNVRRWAAWAPGRDEAPAWHAWAKEPAPLEVEGRPEAKFLPAMLRRRCTPLSRIMLTAAFDCCDGDELTEVRTVFASRHGSVNESLELLESIAGGGRISPAKFSHTVHNAQAGLFSIAAGNRRSSSSLSAATDLVGSAALEALGHLEREPDRPVLLVLGDVPLAPAFEGMVGEASASYAVAMILANGGEGVRLRLRLEPESTDAPELAWPEPVEWLRWLLSDESELRLHRWTWQKL
jgi:3-oxoacyl-[acyl-carrier-protein] synthase-1